VGQFEATGVRSHFEPLLQAAGQHLPPTIYRQGVLLKV
jgi:hypothetical protein